MQSVINMVHPWIFSTRVKDRSFHTPELWVGNTIFMDLIVRDALDEIINE